MRASRARVTSSASSWAASSRAVNCTSASTSTWSESCSATFDHPATPALRADGWSLASHAFTVAGSTRDRNMPNASACPVITIVS